MGKKWKNNKFALESKFLVYSKTKTNFGEIFFRFLALKKWCDLRFKIKKKSIVNILWCPTHHSLIAQNHPTFEELLYFIFFMNDERIPHVTKLCWLLDHMLYSIVYTFQNKKNHMTDILLRTNAHCTLAVLWWWTQSTIIIRFSSVHKICNGNISNEQAARFVPVILNLCSWVLA